MCERCSDTKLNGNWTASGEEFRRVMKARREANRIWHMVTKDQYGQIANELADLLITTWDKTQKEAIENFIRAVKGKEKFKESDLEQMLSDLSELLGPRFAGQVAQPILEVNAKVYELGMAGVIDLKPTFRLVDTDALNWLDEHQIFWVRNYFDRQLAGKVSELGKQVIQDGMNRDEAAMFFKKQFSDRFDVETYRYWDGFANHVTTRAREFGRIDAYQRAGIEYYRVVAILDHRTSGICRYMHNRIIPVSDGIAMRDALMDAKNPEDVKQITPFLKEKDVQGATTGSLKRKSKGYAAPPYHFDCRSRTVSYRKPATTIADSGSNASEESEAHKLTNGLSDDEMALWFDQIKKRGGSMYFNRKDLKSDFLKHGPAFNADSEKQYRNFARTAIKTADRVSISDYKGDLMFNMYSKDGYVVVDSAMQIRGYYKQGDVSKAWENKGKLKSSWYILGDGK